jgi:hypothetical protein
MLMTLCLNPKFPNWIKESVGKLNEALNVRLSSLVIHYAMSVMNHAMLALRLVVKEDYLMPKFNISCIVQL